MSFKTPYQVWTVVDAIRVAGTVRSRNRARINSLFNGDQPYTDQEARDNRIETNVNFLEGTRIIHSARQQFSSAFMQPQNYFTVSLDTGPTFKRQAYGSTITKYLNRKLKRTPRFLAALENQFASVVLHGPGPVTWLRKRDWCPVARGVDDMMIPSNTLQSLENLDHFAVRITFTAAELMRVITAENPDPGWNANVIKKIVPVLLKKAVTASNTESYYDWTNFEKLNEDFKEQSTYWGSDAIPVLRCFDFYYLDVDASDTDQPKWKRKIIIDRQTGGYSEFKDNTEDEWLYDCGKLDYGDSIEKLLHTQFADGSVVPPFRWHSVRSLGYLLYAVCHLMNRVRCKFSDAVFESMLWYFRNVAEGDKERIEMVNLKHLGIIPQGLDFVPGGERHTVDPNLIGGFIAGNRQLMAESAASYVQDVEQKGNTPPSATQIIAKVNAANALIGSMLTRAYTLQTPGYREVARRFCTFDHPDCKKFRDECMADGVPPEIFEQFDAWNIEPDRVMGSGNKMLAIAQADRLMAIRPTLKPAAQEEVTRMYIEATVEDPAIADRLVPRSQPHPSGAVQLATVSWGTLMLAQKVVISDPINRIEYAATLTMMLQKALQQVQAAGQLPSAQIVIGLTNVLGTIEEIAVELQQDPAQKEIVDEFDQVLTEAAKTIKSYADAIQEQQQQQGEDQQMDPAALAKVQSTLLMAQTKSKIQEANSAQKRQQKEIAFIQDQQRKNAQTVSDIATKDLTTKADIARGNMEAALKPTTE